MHFPSLGGNWIDLVILIFLFLYVLSRGRKGFIYEFIDVLGFLFSIILALRFYGIASRLLMANFSLSRGISNTTGFILTAFVCEFAFYFAALYIDRFIDKRLIHSKWNMRLGFVPAVASSLILIIFTLSTLLTLPIRPNIKQDIVESKIGGTLAQKTFGAEKQISEIFGGAVQDTLNFLTVKPEGSEVVDLKFKTGEVNIDQTAEEKMFTLLNEERLKRNLKPLSQNSRMQEVGRTHCTDMFKRGYFSHYNPDGQSPFDRIEKVGITYRAAGENLAYAPTVEIAHQGLMDSPGHRANILSADFGEVGIGVISAGIYGKMFCQEFKD